MLKDWLVMAGVGATLIAQFIAGVIAMNDIRHTADNNTIGLASMEQRLVRVQAISADNDHEIREEMRRETRINRDKNQQQDVVDAQTAEAVKNFDKDIAEIKAMLGQIIREQRIRSN